MATSRKNYSSYNSVLTGDSGTKITISTTTGDKRISAIHIGLTISDTDTVTKTESSMKTMHNNLVAFILEKFDNGDL